jgi:glycosyltransferase involved in cell wall biosynthesis
MLQRAHDASSSQPTYDVAPAPPAEPRVQPRRALRIAHVITGLGLGGAEMMLTKLIGNINRDCFDAQVISLSSDTTLAEQIAASGVRVTPLRLNASITSGVTAVRRVLDIVRAYQPHLVQTWLYHADLIGGFAAGLAGVPTVWNVQSGILEASGFSRRTRAIVRACAAASYVMPRAMVSCSRDAIRVHSDLGYATDRFVLIPNGADLEGFKPNPQARATLRLEVGAGDNTPVIGMISRYHPQKDHATFFDAARLLIATHPHARFVLVGDGLEEANPELMQTLQAADLCRHVRLLGRRHDIAHVLCGLDIHTLSSAFGEGFPNVVAEAMATGVPCVVTEVGDSALIVGDTGRSVAPRQPQALAHAWRELIDMPAPDFARLRESARHRIASEFSLAASVRRYEELYARVATA